MASISIKLFQASANTASTCSFDRVDTTEIEVWYDDTSDLSADTGVQLYQTNALSTPVDTTYLNDENGILFWAIKDTSFFGQIKIDGDTGLTSTTTIGCSKSFLANRWELSTGSGTPITQASEGDTVSLFITALGDFNNGAINYAIVSGPNAAEYSDLLNLGADGSIPLSQSTVDTFLYQAVLTFTINTDTETEVLETLGFDLSSTDGTTMGLSAATLGIVNVAPTYTFTDWNGSVSVDAAGVVTIDNGNATAVVTDPVGPVAANTTAGTNDVSFTVEVTVPPGYVNIGLTVVDTVTVVQPGLPSFVCADANLDLSDVTLEIGESIAINQSWIGAGTVTLITPDTIQAGSQIYAVSITAPAGYANSGTTIVCDDTIDAGSAPVAVGFTVNMDQGTNEDIDIFALITDDDPSDHVDFEYFIGTLDDTSTGGTLGTFDTTTGLINYAAPSLTFAEGNKTQSFDFTARDPDGNDSNSGTVEINITAALNQPPQFVATPYSIGGVELNDIIASTRTFDATDIEGHTISYGITTPLPTKGTATIDTVSKTISYIPNAGEVGTDGIRLTATDTEGDSTTVEVIVNINQPTYFDFRATPFYNTEDDACLDANNSIVWVPTTSATSITGANGLTVGDTIYSDNNGLNTYAGSGSQVYSKITQETSTGPIERILEINPSGQIISIGNCTTQSNLFNETQVRYSGSETLLCDEKGEVVNVAYAILDPADPDKDLQTLVSAGTILFTSGYWANLFANGLNLNLEGQIPAGLYQAATPNAGDPYYKRNVANTWSIDPSAANNAAITGWACPADIEYTSYSITGVEYATDADTSCNSTGDEITIWYRVPDVNANPGAELSLLEIAKQGVSIFSNEIAADENQIAGLLPSGVYSTATSNGYLVWDNEGDGFEYAWYGFNGNNQLVKNAAITKTGTCDFYDRPGNISTPRQIEGDGGINDTNVYYAYLSCEASENTNNSDGTANSYWKLYVIDAGYDVYRNDGITTDIGTSYLKEFTSEMTLAHGSDITLNVEGYPCLEFRHTVYSENINDAINALISGGYYSNNNVELLGVNPIDIGLGSQRNVKIYNNCNECRTDKYSATSDEIGEYTLPVVDDSVIEALGPNFDLESNYTLDNVSKPLLRTNPKLTTNIKLVVNEKDLLYLESISASKELAAIEYKKFPINKDGKYSYDVANFYNVNMTPNDLMFQTKRDYSDITILDSYEKQIEETYQYGTNYNFSKLHDEDFRIFAPIWLDTNMPKNFVIYRVKDPIGSLSLGDNAADNFTRIKDILKNAEIIKSFDLTRGSNIGNYLRNHVQDEMFPSSPITVNFEKSEKSNFNGIDLIKGGFTSKGEYLYKDYILTDKPLIESNDYITDAFKRNQIASANLINLEFLFNDDLSSEYSINRYFGLYTDDIDSGYGRIFSINGKIHHFKELTSLVDSSVPETAIPSYSQVTNLPLLGYANIGKKFFNISSNKSYDAKEWKVAIEDDGNKISDYLGIQSTGRSVELVENKEHGYDFSKIEVIDTPNTNDMIGITSVKEEANKFTFIKHVSGQSLQFGMDDPNSIGNNKVFTIVTGATAAITINAIKLKIEQSLMLDGNGNEVSILPQDAHDIEVFKELFDVTYVNNSFFLTEKRANLGDMNLRVLNQQDCIIKNDRIQTNVILSNHLYYAESQIDAGKFSGLRYSNQGSMADVAVALAACIDFNESAFSSYNIGNYVYVVSSISGYELLQSCILLAKSNVKTFLVMPNEDSLNKLQLQQNIETLANSAILEQYDAYYLSGGNAPGKSVLINNETLSEISVDDYIETRIKGVYNKVLDIVEDISVLNSKNSKIILNDTNDLISGSANVFYENEMRLGLFSAYDMYDLNVDFYDTSNSDIKELVHETQEEINYEPYINAVNNIDELTGVETTILGARDIFSEDFELNPIDYFSNLSKILTEETVDDEVLEQITSEYDRLKENNLKEYATNSRIVPNINKWVLKDTVTVREQPYYLNVNEAFGRTNFSPDLSVSERDREAMTHEWFYMEKPPKYLKYDQLNDTFSYINFIDGFDLSANLFKSTTNNYFDMFMISDGFEKTLTEEDLIAIYDDIYDGDPEINMLNGEIKSFIKTNLKKKYSMVAGGNNISFASTIFKGIKVEFKNRKEFNNDTASEFVKSSEFNGYKFSVLLKVNDEAETNSISYEVIQNKKFKFVVMYITLNLGDYWIDNNMNRKLLYELNHKIVYNSNDNDFTYADTKFNGALQFNSSAINWAAEGPYIIPGISHINGSLPAFDSQITLGSTGLYGDIYIDLFPLDDTNSIYKVSVVSVDSDSSIKISGKPVNINDPADVLDIEFLPNSVQIGATYTYVGGGANAHKIILEKLTAKTVADLVNLNNNEITYTTVTEHNGGVALNNRFVINFSDGTEIIQRSNLDIEEDTDKPKSFKLFKGNIGYNLTSNGEYYPFLVRHNGSYTVDMKPVVTFTDIYSHFKINRLQLTTNTNELKFEEAIYKHSLTDLEEFNRAAAYYKRYNKCGTAFNLGFISDSGSHDSNWGLIQNHFYHKVNEINPSGVTKLSTTSDKLPMYPLIGEIAIDKKDINVFRSSWDSNYYTRSLAGGNSINIPGTLDTHEERSYLASTVMKPKYSYNLLDFSVTYVTSEEKQDSILRNSENESDVVVYENQDYIIADFYIADTLISKLAKEGVLDSITKYVLPVNSAGNKETLNDDALMYAENNLIETYILDSIQLYTKRFKGKGSKIINAVTIDQLDADGFTLDKNNFAYRNHVQKPMNFRLIYNKRLGYSYDIKPMIKIKS